MSNQGPSHGEPTSGRKKIALMLKFINDCKDFRKQIPSPLRHQFDQVRNSALTFASEGYIAQKELRERQKVYKEDQRLSKVKRKSLNTVGGVNVLEYLRLRKKHDEDAKKARLEKAQEKRKAAREKEKAEKERSHKSSASVESSSISEGSSRDIGVTQEDVVRLVISESNSSDEGLLPSDKEI